ncbi:MAG: hypothetical protein IJX80_05090 [Clostridia bacterium]|nr:hypothetical protein [Clostridia bacterium]
MRRFQCRTPSRVSQILLQIEAPIILLYAIVYLISYMIAWETDPTYAIIHYHPYITYLPYPAIITAFSVLLIERLQME